MYVYGGSGAFATFYYFTYLIVLIPFLGIVENILLELNLPTYFKENNIKK
jgi:hypothetical protein